MTHVAVVRKGLALVPAFDSDRDALAKIEPDRVYRFDFKRERNPKFFRKWWALAKLAFDAWADGRPAVTHLGIPVAADFERFRKDLTILAGFYRSVYRLDGAVELEPESLAWGNMSEERFEELYSATIQVILDRIPTFAGVKEGEIRRMVDEVVGFA